jgi:copper chaperone CopZ
MKKEVYIQNLKCGGCANTVKKELLALEGVSDVHVDVDTAIVSFESEDEDVSDVLNRLNDLGYPPEDDENSIYKKAKSFVSCAVGRMSSDKE